MNKQAYFRMMGLTKLAAPSAQSQKQAPAAPAQQPAAAPAQQPAAPAPFNYNAAMPEAMLNLSTTAANLEQLSLWQRIWNMILGLFGNKEAKDKLKREETSTAAYNAAAKASNTVGKNQLTALGWKQGGDLTAEQQNAEDQHNAYAQRAVRRGISARDNAIQLWKTLGKTEFTFEDLVKYLSQHGYINSKAPGYESVKPVLKGVTPEQKKKIEPYEKKMTKVQPTKVPSFDTPDFGAPASWQNQLYGNTGNNTMVS